MGFGKKSEEALPSPSHALYPDLPGVEPLARLVPQGKPNSFRMADNSGGGDCQSQETRSQKPGSPIDW